MPSHRSSPWQAAAAAFRHSSRSRADLLAYQDRAVARLVAHAGARVPFPLSMVQASMQGRSHRNDLQLLPVTTKDEIRVAPACDLLDETLDPSRLVSISTTGSTEGRSASSIRGSNTGSCTCSACGRSVSSDGAGRPVRGDRPADHAPSERSQSDRKAPARGRARSAYPAEPLRDTQVLLERLVEFAPDIVTSYPSVLLRLGRSSAARRVAASARAS